MEAGLDPQKIKAVLVSHRHPDHFANAEVLVEAMTKGMLKKRGVIAAPPIILDGTSEIGPALSIYHQNMISEVITLKPGVKFRVDNTKVQATQTRHTDSEAVGFRFHVPEVGEIGYTADTEYFEGIEEDYKGLRVLIISVMRPLGSPWIGHMTPQEAAKIVDVVKPELVVATHFGMKMLYSGPIDEVKLIEETTGVPTVASFDGMRLHVDKKISIKKSTQNQQIIRQL